jgi:hypothetical protein
MGCVSSGCYFWLPLVEEQSNMSPEIEYSSPELNSIFVLDAPSGSVAWVAVTDPDEGDTMEYLWTIDGLGPQATATAFVNEHYQGSAITLQPDALYDGRTLTCMVYDSRGASTRATWEIEVPEGVGQ